MSRSRNALITLALLTLTSLAAAQDSKYPGVGRAATP